MQWKSTLDLLLENIGPLETHIALSKTDPESTREKYIEYIGSAHRSVKIVAGEANGKLFNQPDMRDAMRGVLLHSNESTVELVFHKYDNVDRAEEAFQVDNIDLVNLKREFPDRTHIYWSPIRPRQHYAVLDDGEKAILEEPSHKGYASFWAAVVLDPSRAKSWANRFDEYIEYCTELNFESLD